MRKRGVSCFKPMRFEIFVMKMLSKNKETWCHMYQVKQFEHNKRKRGDTRNKEYMEMIKEQTQNRKYK